MSPPFGPYQANRAHHQNFGPHKPRISLMNFGIDPYITGNAKSRLEGNASARTAIERCIRKLLSNDVDAVVDGEVDQKIDTFWDELKHFQNRLVH